MGAVWPENKRPEAGWALRGDWDRQTRGWRALALHFLEHGEELGVGRGLLELLDQQFRGFDGAQRAEATTTGAASRKWVKKTLDKALYVVVS